MHLVSLNDHNTYLYNMAARLTDVYRERYPGREPMPPVILARGYCGPQWHYDDLKDESRGRLRLIAVEEVPLDGYPTVILEGFHLNVRGPSQRIDRKDPIRPKELLTPRAYTFSTGNVVLSVFVPTFGNAHGIQYYEVAVSTKEGWTDLTTLETELKKIDTRLRPGIWRVRMTQFGPSYEPAERTLTVPTQHPAKETLLQQIEMTLRNPAPLLRYGRSGTLKLLLVGPPGTGKSTMLTEAARLYQDKLPVAFCTELEEMRAVMERAAQNSQPLIVICEDADSTLRDDEAETLNFLDGIDQPRNEGGCVVILSTNYPGRLSPRVRRPGRVDKIIRVGELEGDYALACARLYFPEDAQLSDEELLPWVNRFTGAQIMTLATTCTSVAAYENRTIDAALVRQVFADIYQSTRGIDSYGEARDPITEGDGAADEEAFISVAKAALEAEINLRDAYGSVTTAALEAEIDLRDEYDD